MKRHLNYEDNIFILNTRIRMIADLLLLEADEGLFLNKTIEEVDFLDGAVNVLLSSLLENKQIIDWDMQLHNLYDTAKRYGAVLESIRSGKAIFSTEKYPALRELMNKLSASSAERQKNIKENMDMACPVENDPRFVSVEELMLLTE
ncbi:MAG: hypothetical protein LBT01_01215 [Spirochaetaceae bacterium]|jgi:hypothetical protein|nr:hypothetical protein [Spirochaetaceae bacterium]